MAPTESSVLSAPMKVEFGYTRSLGPVLSRFMSALAQQQVADPREPHRDRQN